MVSGPGAFAEDAAAPGGGRASPRRSRCPPFVPAGSRTPLEGRWRTVPSGPRVRPCPAKDHRGGGAAGGATGGPARETRTASEIVRTRTPRGANGKPA